MQIIQPLILIVPLGSMESVFFVLPELLLIPKDCAKMSTLIVALIKLLMDHVLVAILGSIWLMEFAQFQTHLVVAQNSIVRALA
jgi:hypothetical protein